MRVLALSLTALLVTACSSLGSSQEERNPKEVALELINEGNFEEAHKFTSSHVNTFAGYQITKTATCAKELLKCDPVPQSRNKLRRCSAYLASHCMDSVVGKWRDMKSRITKEIAEAEKSQASKIPSYAEACTNGFKWGYVREHKVNCTNCTASSFRIPYDKLFGQFGTSNECEEHRVLDSEWITSTKCYRRYVGSSQSTLLYRATALVKPGRSETPQKLELYFVNAQRCAETHNNGTAYMDLSNQDYEIGGSGKSEGNRFVGKCDKITISLCKPNEPDLLFHGDVLDAP